jgi:hypothetical protein
MNRFAARMADMTPDDQQAMLAKMQVSASALGLSAVTAFGAQAADPNADPYDVAANLRTLMATFSASPPDTPGASDPPDTPAPPTWDSL